MCTLHKTPKKIRTLQGCGGYQANKVHIHNMLAGSPVQKIKKKLITILNRYTLHAVWGRERGKIYNNNLNISFITIDKRTK